MSAQSNYPNKSGDQPPPALERKEWSLIGGSSARKADPKGQHKVIEQIDELLERGLPVIVDVAKRNTDLYGGHYLVVYGRTAEERLLTADPGWDLKYLDDKRWQYVSNIEWVEKSGG